jgi:tRNA A-37 threonylcarbamoyl transferase component Bud32
LLVKQAQLQILSQHGLDAEGLLLRDGSLLKNLSVVRHLPKRRLVCRGEWGDVNVYVKLFFGKDYHRYAQRDEAGVQHLIAANLLTPRLLYSGELPKGQGAVLIFHEIESAENAEKLWTQLDNKARLNLAKQLVKTLAQHHQANLLQTDLHLKNFLVQDETVYTLDGDGIRAYARLSRHMALKNLSVLFSKFDILDMEVWLEDLLHSYTQVRDLQPLPDVASIKARTNAQRLKTAHDYADKKVFRQCSDVNIAEVQGLFIAVSNETDLSIPRDVAQLDALIQPHNLLKNGNTCTVALAEIDNRKVVVKRYNINSFWHGVSRAFRPSRAAASWANAHRLSILDIATAKPVAFYEKRIFGLRGKAYFLAECLDLPDVAEYFAQTQNQAQRGESVKNIVTLFYKLYLLQISHGDMKATNIKMRATQPVLIDLDSMRQHRKSNPAEHIQDLRRFMQNWQNDNALYNAFVQTFKLIYPHDSMLVEAGIATKKEFI